MNIFEVTRLALEISREILGDEILGLPNRDREANTSQGTEILRFECFFFGQRGLNVER